jgi:hypothetical protein
MAPAARVPLRARLAMSASEFANERGVYLGKRSTKIHVALYRRSGGRLGGHLPAWPAAGQPTQSAWFHNLAANPDTTIQIGREARSVRARVANDVERDRLWPRS